MGGGKRRGREGCSVPVEVLWIGDGVTTGEGQYRLQRGVVLEQGDTQDRAHSIWELSQRSVTQTEDRVTQSSLRTSMGLHSFPMLGLAWNLGNSSGTNWSKCNNRCFKIQFKHPVCCEHYAGVRWCVHGVEDAAWQGIIYVGTWLTPCIANMSQDLQYRRPERRKWKCDENLNRCECTLVDTQHLLGNLICSNTVSRPRHYIL